MKLHNQKQQLRRELKNRRDALTRHQLVLGSEKITSQVMVHPRFQSANTVFIYLSFASEVRTQALIERLLEEGKTIAVPKIIDKEKMLSVAFHGWDDLITAELGILTPESAKPLNTHYDLVITPGLGFTQRGERIGFGAGYYDRWFAKNSFNYSIALAFDEQIVAELPVDEFDQTVDEVITPDNHYVVEK